MKRLNGFLGAASLVLALPAAPAHAAGGITNFTVTNCTQERLFVCSFDKTDSAMNIPYKAGGIQKGDRKEFGCASINRCKVIIGVSRKKRQTTVSNGVSAGVTSGAIVGGALGGAAFGYVTVMGANIMVIGLSTTVTGGLAAVILGAVAGSVIGSLEIADGWKDGEVCDRVRKAAQKAGIKPKVFMRNGKNYQVVERYAADENGNIYINADGTAVMAYTTKQDKGKCPAALPQQLVPN